MPGFEGPLSPPPSHHPGAALLAGPRPVARHAIALRQRVLVRPLPRADRLLPTARPGAGGGRRRLGAGSAEGSLALTPRPLRLRQQQVDDPAAADVLAG